MGCFQCGVPTLEEEEEPLVVDVNQLLKDKAWNNFKYSFGYCGRKFLRRKNFTIEVPENYFVFEQIEQSITTPERGGIGASKPSGTAGNNKAGGKDLLAGKVPKNRSSNPEAISLDTTFYNDTAQKQTYEFKFSKTRTTTVEVSFQKGFTIGGKASFSLGVPKVLGDGSLGLETEMQYEVTNSRGQTFEESMNMEATSNIAVGPMSNYIANVQLEERHVHASFQVRTRMSMPQGRAPVYIRKKSDDALVFVYNVNNLKDVFIGKVPCAEKVMEEEKVVKDKIDFVVEGIIKGSLACDHRINLISDETDEEKKLAKRRQYHGHNDEED